MISKAEQKTTYPLSLLLSIDRKKTAESLSKICDTSGDTMLRILERNSIKSSELIDVAKAFFGTDLLNVLLDDQYFGQFKSYCMRNNPIVYKVVKIRG